MPRPSRQEIQLTIDGREVRAVEGSMLVDAAKFGDIEIPYFCYEPKLGNPVGACRMCLVEIEGIPKLQTSCSTPVKDGMVVHTQTERVRHAQNAVVEFLLVNHPLDCPVCDKGGECPLQDITFGWGLGRSRVVEPKRHFEKPLALSPLIAIDRERCILCYRCVRFSQEIAEDWQLIFTERGADTFVGTHDGHPYVAPFSGNIIELCPVGALTSQPYRFRARPWDIEGAAGICTLCPSQCNVEFTVRDEKVLRVVARDPRSGGSGGGPGGNPDVDDGWLCDKGRFAYQAIHVDERITKPLVRDGGSLREVAWERAYEAAGALGRHRGHVGALVGGGATNEEAFLLQRLLREGLDSPDIDSGCLSSSTGLARALFDPGLQATVPDLEFAHTVLVLGCEPLDEAPILDLRIRKGVRRNGVKLVVATARPSALDPNASLVVRYPPGSEAAFIGGLTADLASASPSSELAKLLRDGGEDVVILWGERLGGEAARSLLQLTDALSLSGRDGAGLLCIPTSANGRGVREAGAVADAGPGYAAGEGFSAGRDADRIAVALADGSLQALYLLETDPLRDRPDRALWEAAMHHAGLVVAHASVLTEGLREHANVIFPAESSAEKEGTVVHPDGRVQRLRAAIGHPNEVRAGWSVIATIARSVGLDLGVLTSSMAFAQLVEAVPAFHGLTLEQIGGLGVRWPELAGAASRLPASSFDPPAARGRDVAQAAPTPQSTATPSVDAPEQQAAPERYAEPALVGQPSGNGHGGPLRLGTYRPIWAAPEVEISPSLQFLRAEQQVELSPDDASKLNLHDGDHVGIAQNGTRLQAKVAVRTGVPAGTAFLAVGVAQDSANAFTEPLVTIEADAQ
jgi:NADH-quinone oxidoreductase subunit G